LKRKFAHQQLYLSILTIVNSRLYTFWFHQNNGRKKIKNIHIYAVFYSNKSFLHSMYLYLQLLCIFVILPNIILFYFNRKKIHLKTMLLSLFILFLIAILWDQLSVRMGLWSFSQNEILGSLFGLPIEEYLFFIFVPLLSINIYLLIEKILSNDKKKKMNYHG